MFKINSKPQAYGVVLCDASSYTIVIIQRDLVTTLFTLNAYTTIPIEHGEFGDYFFINHSYFFKCVDDFFINHNYKNKTIALLFKEPFITHKAHPLIPSLHYDDCIIAYPLLLQSSIIPPIHGITVTALTHSDKAHEAAINFTQHAYDEYSIHRLFTKKTGTDFIRKEHYYNVIAACGAYLIEGI